MPDETFANRPRWWETAVPLILAVLLIAWRFRQLGLAPFIRDEPILQMMLDRDMAKGQFPLLGLMGSYGLRYGPTAMWYYLPLRWITNNVNAILIWHALSFVAAFSFFFASVRRTIGLRAASWGTVLAASSPLLFFYSRLAWDNTLFVLLSALLLHELIRVRINPEPKRLAILGFICGLALNLHPMAVPGVMAAILCAIPVLRGRMRNILCFVTPILIQLALYGAGLRIFWAKWEGVNNFPVHLPAGAAFPSLGLTLLGLMQYFTPAALQAFFGGDTNVLFTNTLAPPLAMAFSSLALSAMIGWSSVFLLISRRTFNVATQLALTSLFLAIVFYTVVRPNPMHPHYFTPYWWIGFFALGSLVEHAPPCARRILQAFILLLVAVNTNFLSSMQNFIAQNEGTRDLSYGSSIRETRRITQEFCSAIQDGNAVLHLDAVPGLTPPPIAYLASHLDECKGRRIFFYPQVSPMMAMRHYKIVYENPPPSASLTLLPMPSSFHGP